MKVVIVEDEQPSAQHLVDLLARVAPDAEVIAQLASIEATVRWLATHDPPTLVFADVELQDGQVFDAFRQVRSAVPVIFTTAYDRFVLDAFRAQGIAYLLKPFGEPELAAALAKYEELRHGFASGQFHELIQQLAEPTRYRRHFTVKAGRRIRVLPLERVALVVLGKAGVELVDTVGAVHFPSGELSLTEVERGVPPARFFRINRTELIALDAIHHIETQGERLVVTLKPSRTCTVSVHRAAAFRTWFGIT